MLNKIIYRLVFSCVAFTAGCSAENNLSGTKQNYEKKVTETILIHMDLETMFPSDKLRELAKAAGKGQLATVDKLVQDGVDVNAKGRENATALFWSMRNEKGFNHLLKLGANPNVVFGDGSSVMHWAARKSECSLLKTALSYGGNPNLKAGLFGGSPAFNTITAGKNTGVPDCLKLLLRNNADIEFRDENGKTLLLRAAALGRYDIVLFLLGEGASSNVKDLKGRTLRTILSEDKDAFLKGSVTQINWFKVKEWLDKNNQEQ